LGEFNQSPMQAVEFGPLQQRHLAQSLDVSFRLDLHASY
jgi:hypothetical protein